VQQLLEQLGAARGEHKSLLMSIAGLLPAHPAEQLLGLAEGAAEPEAEASPSAPAAESGGGGGAELMPTEEFRSRWAAGEAERLEGKFERHTALFIAHASSATGGVDLAAVDAEMNPKTQAAELPSRRTVARRCVLTGTEMKAFTPDTFGDFEDDDATCAACRCELDSSIKMFAGAPRGHDSSSFPGYCLCEKCYDSSCCSLAELPNLDPLAQIVSRVRVLPADLLQSLVEMIAGVVMHPILTDGEGQVADPLGNWLEVEDGVDEDGDPIERYERIDGLIAGDGHDDDEDNDDDEDRLEAIFDAMADLCSVVQYIAQAADTQRRTALVEQLTAVIVQGHDLPLHVPVPESPSEQTLSRATSANSSSGTLSVIEVPLAHTKPTQAEADTGFTIQGCLYQPATNGDYRPSGQTHEGHEVLKNDEGQLLYWTPNDGGHWICAKQIGAEFVAIERNGTTPTFGRPSTSGWLGWRTDSGRWESESAMVVSPRDGVVEYVVRGAGVAVCNGVYTRSSNSDQDGVPSFINGEILMLRYKLPSGTQWWYLADGRSLDRTAGDYYRLQSSSDTPPLSGWQIDGQTPDGQTPLPIVSVASAATDTIALHAESELEGAAADILTTRAVVQQLRSRGKTTCSQDEWEAEFVAAELARLVEKEDVALELAADNWTGSLVGLWHLAAIGLAENGTAQPPLAGSNDPVECAFDVRFIKQEGGDVAFLGSGQFAPGGPAFIVKGKLDDSNVTFVLQHAEVGTSREWQCVATLSDDGCRLVDGKMGQASFTGSRDGVDPSRHIVQSKHPYVGNETMVKTVTFPGAEAIEVMFDKRCDTERGCDSVSIAAMGSEPFVFSGKRGTATQGSDSRRLHYNYFPDKVIVLGDQLQIRFKSDDTQHGWGFKCVCTKAAAPPVSAPVFAAELAYVAVDSVMKLGAAGSASPGLSVNGLRAKQAMDSVCKYGRAELGVNGEATILTSTAGMVADPAGSPFFLSCLEAVGLPLPSLPVAAKALAAVFASCLHHCNKASLMEIPQTTDADAAAVPAFAVAALRYASDHVLRFGDSGFDSGAAAAAAPLSRGSSAKKAEDSLDHSSSFVQKWLQDVIDKAQFLLTIRPAAGSLPANNSGSTELSSSLSRNLSQTKSRQTKSRSSSGRWGAAMTKLSALGSLGSTPDGGINGDHRKLFTEVGVLLADNSVSIDVLEHGFESVAAQATARIKGFSFATDILQIAAAADNDDDDDDDEASFLAAELRELASLRILKPSEVAATLPHYYSGSGNVCSALSEAFWKLLTDGLGLRPALSATRLSQLAPALCCSWQTHDWKKIFELGVVEILTNSHASNQSSPPLTLGLTLAAASPDHGDPALLAALLARAVETADSSPPLFSTLALCLPRAKAPMWTTVDDDTKSSLLKKMFKGMFPPPVATQGTPTAPSATQADAPILSSKELLIGQWSGSAMLRDDSGEIISAFDNVRWECDFTAERRAKIFALSGPAEGEPIDGPIRHCRNMSTDSGGDKVPTILIDSSGCQFCLALRFETPDRLIMVGHIAGERVPSDWASWANGLTAEAFAHDYSVAQNLFRWVLTRIGSTKAPQTVICTKLAHVVRQPQNSSSPISSVFRMNCNVTERLSHLTNRELLIGIVGRITIFRFIRGHRRR
jgi:hypothetical protein